MSRTARPGAGKASAPRQPVTPELIRAALASIPADTDRDTWVRVGMAVKASDLAEAEAFDAWCEWSQRGEGYSERDARDTWRSIKAGGRVTVATLFGMAKANGFKPPRARRAAVQASVSAEGQRQAEAAKARRQAEREAEAAALAQRQAEAAERCRTLWASASDNPPAMGAPYLQRKGVQAHGLRFLPGGVALVPMRDEGGELWSLQRLLPKALRDPGSGEASTDKLYGPPKLQPDERVSSRKTGLFHLVGQVEGAAVLLLAEGYATGASLHEATGRPVAVCFDAGNLVHVACALRQRHPALALLVCGDDDRGTEARKGKNPGRVAALKAVETVASSASASDGNTGQAGAVFPAFTACTGTDANDFNDLHQLPGADGLAAVRGQVEAACAALLAGRLALPPATGLQGAAGADAATRAPADALQGRHGAARARRAPAGGEAEGGDGAAELGGPGGGGAVPPAGGAGGGGGDDDDDSAGDLDAFGGRRDPFHLDDRGVWFTARDRDGQEKPPRWLCAPLEVLARTRSDTAEGWGYLLRFSDPDGNEKTWAAPMAMFSGEGAEWAARLRDMGLRMASGPGARNLVGQYVETRQLAERVTCTDRVGWHGGGVYVLPSGCIGQAEGRRFVFQSEAGMEDTFRRAGELAQWRDEVAGRARGNSRLVFALCCSFAGPMLRPAGVESGGFHFRGTSSMGKTTALKGAASVWGRPSYMQRWRTTDNALEATAVQHCDGTLILDEFGQLDPRVAGECAYMLANDQEKGRATRGGLVRKRRTWRLLFVSSGEVSLADHMAEAGKRTQAGMEVRMVDVPLDAGAGMGGLEELHGHESPGELADAFTAAAARHYGTAGRVWLEWACEHHAELPELLAGLIDRQRVAIVPEAAAEQVRRVGTRFALVAAAGELAMRAGITGWPEGHASWAARQCFNAWLAARGHLDNGEEAAMVRQVRAWLEKNGDALFTWVHRGLDDHKPATPLRAGFKRLVDSDGKPLKLSAADDYVEKRTAADWMEGEVKLVEYLVLPEAWKREVCKGFDAAAVARLLRQRGHLVHEADRLTMKHRLPGMDKAPVFHVRPSIFTDELGGL